MALEPLRLGLIGAGRWGQVLLRSAAALPEIVRITHISVRNPERLASSAPGIAVTDDWKKLIASDCEAVLIAAPDPLHAEMVSACLAAKKPCWVEKPLTLDLPSTRRLNDAVRKSGLPVWVNHIQLFNPAYQAVKEAVRKAGGGIRAIVTEEGDLGPFRRQTDLLWDRLPHDLALCLDLLSPKAGAVPEPESVRLLAGMRDGAGRPNMVTLALTFPGRIPVWIQSGRLKGRKQRELSVFTDQTLFRFDDQAPVKASRLQFRYEAPAPDSVGPRRERAGEALSIPSKRTPVQNALEIFARGVRAGQTTSPFGTDLALAIAKILDQCEEKR